MTDDSMKETPATADQPDFAIGDYVEKVGGDYQFTGWVVGVPIKRSGAVRYVVEDDRGVLHIYSAKILRRATPLTDQVTVTASALRDVLIALTGPAHIIRELQAIRGLESLGLGASNPIDVLMNEFNVWQKENA